MPKVYKVLRVLLFLSLLVWPFWTVFMFLWTRMGHIDTGIKGPAQIYSNAFILSAFIGLVVGIVCLYLADKEAQKGKFKDAISALALPLVYFVLYVLVVVVI